MPGFRRGSFPLCNNLYHVASWGCGRRVQIEDTDPWLTPHTEANSYVGRLPGYLQATLHPTVQFAEM